MARVQSKGSCQLCGGTFNKGSMSNHLKNCFRKHRPAPPRAPAAVIHLIVEGRYQPEYWMHLAARPDAMLWDVDELLRDVWCECCGHLSAFRSKERRASAPNAAEMFQALSKALQQGASPPDLFGVASDDLDEETPLRDALLPPKRELEYTYDFGSSTELKVRSVAMYECPKTKIPVEILARNEAPEFQCVECGKPAVAVCTECGWQGDALYCKSCLRKHSCGDEVALPVVNSPRMGVCGYTGRD